MAFAPRSRRSESRTDRTQSAGDHCDELIEPEVSHLAEHSGDIPMRQASMNGHRVAIADEQLSLGQPIPDDGEQIVRQVRDIGHGLMLDLAILNRSELQHCQRLQSST